MTIIELIFDEMQSDSFDCDSEKESLRMIHYFSRCSEKEKEAINYMFAIMCGYSFTTLIQKQKDLIIKRNKVTQKFIDMIAND